jgi:hypothetical protein
LNFGSLRAPEPGNWPGRSFAIKLTYGKRATVQAATRVKLEQASKVVTWTPTRPESTICSKNCNPFAVQRLLRADRPVKSASDHFLVDTELQIEF